MTLLVDRRELYRASLSECAHIALEVCLPSGRCYRNVALSDLSLSGAGAIFSGDTELELTLRDRVMLRFRTEDKDLSTWAHIRNVLELPGFARVGFEFEHRDKLQAQLPTDLFQFFNRRSAPRVKDLHLGCSLCTVAGEQVHAELTDLSASGAGIVFDLGQGPSLSVGHSLALRFQFSTVHEPIKMVSQIRNVHLLPYATDWRNRVGVEFDATATPSFKDQRDAVSLFVSQKL